MARMQKTHDQVAALGIDFGTTNSSMALAMGNSRMQLASFPSFPSSAKFSRRRSERIAFEVETNLRRLHVVWHSALKRY